MAGKRKRSRYGRRRDNRTEKRQRTGLDGAGHDTTVRKSLLTLYYPQVMSLREHLLSKLPPTSKIRRKKILSISKRNLQDVVSNEEGSKVRKFCDLLDNTLVGAFCGQDASMDERMKQFISFSQRDDRSGSELGVIQSSGGYCQAEVSAAPFHGAYASKHTSDASTIACHAA